MIILFIFMIFPSFASSQVLERIVTAEETPTNYTINGEVTGTTTAIVRELLRLLDREVEIELFPWARSMRIAQKEPNVIIFTAGKTSERVNYGFHFLGPVSTRKHVLYKKKNSPIEINNIDDLMLSNWVIGGLREDWRVIYFKSIGLPVQEFNTHEIALGHAIRDHVDLWISSDLEAPMVARSIEANINDFEIAYVFKKAPSYIMFSRDFSPKLLQEWRRAFSAMNETDFFAKTAMEWSAHLNINLDHHRDRGFFIKD
ncbi:substrate-binding periplasmic protein [Kiloniella sp.]|uniref:substrate-binding periplasmic protein n=1 Tax=Kiloniella sp. TaxID=1938587 RepID=UPI003B014E11